MRLHNAKEFWLGFFMAVVFAVVLVFIFVPMGSEGHNMMERADQFFNSISKGSSYYFPQLAQDAEAYDAAQFSVNARVGGANMARVEAVAKGAGLETNVVNEDTLKVSGNLGAMFKTVIRDSVEMYENRDQALVAQYDIPGREAMYAWYVFLRRAYDDLQKQKHFEQAAFVHELSARAVELSYNYYGVEARSVSGSWMLLTASLVFYVGYTLLWGYAVFFMSEGAGLRMSKGSKVEH